MSLILHRAPRADELVDGLARLLQDPLPDPFESELVLVPAKGIERWLSQQLSHRLGPAAGRGDGVCAGVAFRTPASLVAELTGTPDDDPWAPDALVWPLLSVIDAGAGQPWCRTLDLHLGATGGSADDELRRGRRYAVARRLAGLFASYAVQRPALLAAWEEGRDEDGAGSSLPPDLAWQPELWRRVVAAVPSPSPHRRQRAALERIRGGDVDLPARLSLFGHTRIPVTEVELLGAVGTVRDAHLWLPHPSDALWRALGDLHGAVPRREDTSHERVGNRLLSALGRDLRELQRTLTDVDLLDASTPEPQAPVDTLLGRLQAGVEANSLRAGDPVAPTDRSVQIHSCHGPARQVEVLREVLLGLLADDPTLEPRDILVMCPDIEAYAPLITAAFGMATTAPNLLQHPGHQLRVMLADRSLTQTNPLLAIVTQLLAIAGGRAEASRVLDLLTSEPVRRRFAISENDLETIATWVERAGIRWSFDASHREEFGLAGYVQNTWRFGLDRILTGVAVSDDAEKYFGTTLPLDDVGSTSIDLAGRLAEFVDRLQAVTDRLTGEHPVEEWLDTIVDGVEQLTDVARDEEWQRGQLHRELRGFVSRGGERSLDLRLPDVRALMAERLAGRPTRANFRTGTLTVCTMTPMRSVPHRVVCLLGVDDGVFPRAGAPDGDDVLARTPLTGERDPRSEDRQLMLDAIVAARDALVVTYTGKAETTGLPRPPAVPLQELLDAIEETAPGSLAHVVHEQPLQAFDPRNLEPGSPFSFDRHALAGARAAARERIAPARLSQVFLPPREGDIELAALVAFLKSPVKEFLRKRLGIALPEDDRAAGDGIPVELVGLQRWACGDRLLADLLHGRTREAARDREWRRGVLPPGKLGWRLVNELLDQAQPVADLADSARAGRRAEALDVSILLGDGRRITGTVPDVFGERIVLATASKLGPKQWLDAWVRLLALCASRPGRGWSSGAVGRGTGTSAARISWTSVPDAEEQLATLVRLYDAGMREPLPLPLKAAHCWATQRSSQASYGRALREWRSEGTWSREDAEPAHVMVWGPRLPFSELVAIPPRPDETFPDETSRLGVLARQLWTPLCERAHLS